MVSDLSPATLRIESMAQRRQSLEGNYFQILKCDRIKINPAKVCYLEKWTFPRKLLENVFQSSEKQAWKRMGLEHGRGWGNSGMKGYSGIQLGTMLGGQPVTIKQVKRPWKVTISEYQELPLWLEVKNVSIFKLQNFLLTDKAQKVKLKLTGR